MPNVNFSQLHEDRALAKRVAKDDSDAFEARFGRCATRLVVSVTA